MDTNVLIYSRWTGSPFHQAAVDRLDELDAAGHELWLGRRMFREYLAGATRPGAITPPPPMGVLLADVAGFEARYRVAEDGPLVTANLLALLAAVPCGGKQVYDANIVATMQAHTIPRVLTHNVADFARFQAYVTVIPLVP